MDKAEADERPGRPSEQITMPDLILKGGSLIDPSQGLSGVHDIAIEQGAIAEIAPAIPLRSKSRAKPESLR